MKNDLISYLSTFVSPERLQRIESVLAQRTRHVSVVVENIYQTHNASAIIRSCECFGVQDVHVIEKDNAFKTNADIVMGAEKWVSVTRHARTDTDLHGPTQTCLMGLKQKGLTIIATTLREGAVPIEQLDVTKPLALVFGTEETGLSDAAHELADVFVKLPMFGFTQSFNVSVSAALCLSHILSKVRTSNVQWRLKEAELIDLRLEWLTKSIQRGTLIVEEWLRNHY